MPHIQNFMKKPTQIEAVLFEGGEANANEIINWVEENGGRARYQPYVPDQTITSNDMDPLVVRGKAERIYVHNLEMEVEWAYPGDYVIKEKDNSFTTFSLEDLDAEWMYMD